MRSPAYLLNDQKFISHYDSSRVLDSAFHFPDQCLSAWNDSYETIVPPSSWLMHNIVFSGMGGSALPGRIIDALGDSILRVPFEVMTSYHVPSYVGLNTLFVATSYSGNTHETINALSEARSKGATVFCIGSGGELEEQAKTYGLPGYFFTPEFNPSKMPRMGLGYLIVGVMGFLAKCGLIKFNSQQALSAFHYLKAQGGNFNYNVSYHQNPAKLLAHSLYGKIPVLMTSSHLLGSSHAFKNQINENAKTFSCSFDIPELNHHLLEGLQFPVTNRANLIFVSIESQMFHPEIKKRIKITKEILERNGIEVVTYHARSGKMYTEALEIVQLGAFVSFYLACLNNIDPGPIPWVDYLKDKLTDI
jgi:glucose/mannose-6-phosphate isomerase